MTPIASEDLEAQQRKQAAIEKKAVWVESTRQTIREGRRYPIKLEPDAKKENHLITKSASATELHCEVYQTTGFSDVDGGHLLAQQLIASNHCGTHLDKANGLLSLMNGIAPQSPLEGVLSAQMTTCHNMAMEFSRRALAEGQSVEAVDRNINRATKLMRTFTAQVEALQKLRNQGQQKITVQHVQVGHGGQAVIGDVHQGGGRA